MVFRRPEPSQAQITQKLFSAISHSLKSNQEEEKSCIVNVTSRNSKSPDLGTDNLDLAKEYRRLVQMSASRISCFVLKTKIERSDSPQKILQEILKGDTVLLEANYTFAKAYSENNPSALIGKKFAYFFNESSGALLQSWIKHDFILPNYETTEESTGLTLLNSIYATFEQCRLRSFWIVSRDVSEMYNALHELQTAEQHYRTLVERPGLVLVRTKLDGSYLYLSPHVKDIVGYSAEEFKNTPGLFAGLLHPEDVDLHEKVILKARRDMRKEVVEIEYRVRCLDGTYRWFFERQSPKFDVNGELEYFDSIALDIQEKKTLERELLQAQRMETIGNLTSGIAHDFNNHLTAMLGQIRIALNQLPAVHPAYKCLLAAETTGLRSAEMTKNLLRFGKGESSKHALINIREFLEETVSLLSYLLPSSIEATLEFLPGLENIKGNYAELQQVLFNLAVNARDAMPQGGSLFFRAGGLELTDTLTQPRFKALKSGKYTQISVSDTGQGIKDSILPFIFDPFFSTKAPGKGSGLGLSMVYSIVKSHNGSIELESSAGLGTNFFLLFPSEVAATHAPATTQKHQVPGGDELILVVEDDESVLQVITQSLKMHGYQILCAKNGIEGLQLYKQNHNKIKLCILDLTIPKMSGQELLREIRELSPSARILLTSGYQEQAALLNVQEVMFLAKPYLLADLLHSVRAALDSVIEVSIRSTPNQP